MKVNILKTIAASVFAAASLSAVAQNLDPTVVVNRAYEGKLLEVHKPELEMAVPDSVQRFDLDFDYSVFENPYKGSYEFKPYQLLLKPMSSDVERSSLWLNAGVGYNLYPELNLVWTPVQKGPFKMSVYGDYNAYFGQYRSFRPNKSSGDLISLDRWRSDDRSIAYWKGYRMRSQAGIDGRYDWEKSALSFDLGYYGVASKDTLKARTFNAFDLSLNMASKPREGEYFHYDVGLDYRFGNDDVEYRSNLDGLTEHDFSVNAVLGPVFSNSSRVLFDVGFEVASYAGAIDASVSQIIFVPHYVLDKGKWNVDLGLRIAKVIRPEDSDFYKAKDQIVYPDIRVRFAAIPEALSLYFKAGGGNTLHTYSSLLEINSFTDPSFGVSSPLLDTSVERVDLRLGFDGRISKRFVYDIYAGFANYASGLLDAIGVRGSASEGSLQYLPGFGYAAYSKIYAGLNWNWHTERISFDGDVEFTNVLSLDKSHGCFVPSPLGGNIGFEYNWNRRVFAGIDCVFASQRKGGLEGRLAVIPGFADLGISAEYALNRKISFWLRGGNLLNMTVQYSPLYAERGLNFTGGIRLKL